MSWVGILNGCQGRYSPSCQVLNLEPYHLLFVTLWITDFGNLNIDPLRQQVKWPWKLVGWKLQMYDVCRRDTCHFSADGPVNTPVETSDAELVISTCMCIDSWQYECIPEMIEEIIAYQQIHTNTLLNTRAICVIVLMPWQTHSTVLPKTSWSHYTERCAKLLVFSQSCSDKTNSYDNPMRQQQVHSWSWHSHIVISHVLRLNYFQHIYIYTPEYIL